MELRVTRVLPTADGAASAAPPITPHVMNGCSIVPCKPHFIETRCRPPRDAGYGPPPAAIQQNPQQRRTGLRLVSRLHLGEAAAAAAGGRCGDMRTALPPNTTLTLFEGQPCSFQFSHFEPGDIVTLTKGALGALHPAATPLYM